MYLTEDEVFKAIEDEEELPGEMPEELYCNLKICFDAQDKQALCEALRILVRMTKQGIRERVEALLTGGKP